MDIRLALEHGVAALRRSPEPLLDAALLLAHVLGVNRAYLAAHPEAPLSLAIQTRYRALVARAALDEPIPYLTGRAPFADMSLAVTPDVLIPRPETEELFALARRWAATRVGPLTVVDVGTGCGCLAIALARDLPGARFYATDRSRAALNVARGNAAAQSVGGQIHFVAADLIGPLRRLLAISSPLVLVANLPYVSDAEWTELPDGVKSYEPSLALRGGPDGLAIIRRLLQQVKQFAGPEPNWQRLGLFLEIGWRQGASAQALARKLWPDAPVSLRQDYAGHDRFLCLAEREPGKGNRQSVHLRPG